jgi:hypothetical protein
MKNNFLQFERALQHTTRVVVAPRGPQKEEERRNKIKRWARLAAQGKS